MKILFLAPQPFFQERGTPIAVRLALQVLSGRERDQIDLLTYHEGQQVSFPRVNLYRIPSFPFLRGVGPGASFKKLLCDVLFAFSALRLMLRARGSERYQLVHAVEEAVFIALFFKFIFKVPYIYDMDSSLALQLQEKWHWMKYIASLLNRVERSAIRHSLSVVPVCDALAAIAEKGGASSTQILRDISLLSPHTSSHDINLRAESGLTPDSKVLLYIGNLERYQGIDLLLESFTAASERMEGWHLVIIGGSTALLEKYKAKVVGLGRSARVHLIGPRPVTHLNEYLLQADLLASPRVRGNNTPMKIYSYLHSGVPIIATNLPTHTQVMNSQVSYLVEPEKQAMAEGLVSLSNDANLRDTLGNAARALAEEKYTFASFESTLNHIYDGLRVQIGFGD